MSIEKIETGLRKWLLLATPMDPWPHCDPEHVRALLDELSRLGTALRDIRDAANSFQDEEGYEVAAQIRIRVDAALSEREGQDG